MGKFYGKKLLEGKKYHVLNDIPKLYRPAAEDYLRALLEVGEISQEKFDEIMEVNK